MSGQVAVVVGVGAEAGLGARLCARFGREGLHVLVAGARWSASSAWQSRSAAEARPPPPPTDTTREADVMRLFEAADAIAPGASKSSSSTPATTDARLRDDGGQLLRERLARGVLRRLPGRTRGGAAHGAARGGTILFTGATASLRGRPPFAAFAAAKAGLRAVAQSMAREFGPQGVHVAHVVIDGGIAGERLERFAEFVRAKGADGLLDLDAIADTYWMLHHQHRTAWTHELDLRPFKEPF